MKKYLPMIIFTSAFIGFVAYATVKTQQTENKKLVETNNGIEEVVESTTNELVNGENNPTDNFIPSVKETPTKNITTVTIPPIIIPPVETPLPPVIETPQIIEEVPPPYIPKKEHETNEGYDD